MPTFTSTNTTFQGASVPSSNSNAGLRSRLLPGIMRSNSVFKHSSDVTAFLLELEVCNYLLNSQQSHRITSDTSLYIRTYQHHRDQGRSRRLLQTPFIVPLQYITARIIDSQGNQVGGTIGFEIDHLSAIFSQLVVDEQGFRSLAPLPCEIIPYNSRPNMGTPSAFEAVPHRDQCRCGRSIARPDHNPWCIDGEILCRACNDRLVGNYLRCDNCDNLMHSWELPTMPANETHCYCEACASQYYDRCEECGRMVMPGTLIRHNSANRCSECYAPEWEPSTWNPPGNLNTYNLVPFGITFGIELETSVCTGYQNLMDNTNWGCAYETSTSGKEFISPVLSGDAGLSEIVNFLDAHTRNWEVNSSCGTHIHLSMQGWDIEAKGRVAYMFRCLEGLFTELLPDRMDNSMCGVCHWNVTELMNAVDIEDFAMQTDKFTWFNMRPLLRQNTIELRILHGTLDDRLIVAWIRFAAKLVHIACTMSWEDITTRFGHVPVSTVRAFANEQYELVKAALDSASNEATLLPMRS